MAHRLCDSCARTGLLNACLVKDQDTGERFVQVEICRNHNNPNLAIKSVEGILETTGLSVILL